MGISWHSISAGAMTAAVSLGSAVQSMGAAAATALPQVTAGGLQAATHLHAAATSAATTLPHAAAAALPQTVGATAQGTSQLAANIGVVEKPAKALAAAAPKLTTLQRAAGFLGKALPVVTVGASALSGAQIVNEHGARGLVTTQQGRGAVLGAVGGALLLAPHPVTQLAAAGVLGAVAVNHFGGFDRLNGKAPVMPGTTPTAGPPPDASPAPE